MASSIEAPKNGLKNRFFLIRHGNAESNVKRIYAADPKVATVEYGLTDKGQLQAAEAVTKFKSTLSSERDLIDRLLIVSSDLRRARETAEILHKGLGVKEPIRFESSLRERGFGTLESLCVDDNPVANLTKLWSLDEADPAHNEYGVESVMEMVMRMSRVIQELDKAHNDRVIVLVSHGDPCQCIHSVFMGISPNMFRKTGHGITNCEVVTSNLWTDRYDTCACTSVSVY